MTVISLDLPLAPSTNRLWRWGRVHRAPRYLSWLNEAGWELASQRPARITGRVRVTIAAGRPDRRRPDVDNFGKALLDLLTKHEVITDDSQVVSLSSSWSDDLAGGRVRVEIKRVRVNRSPVSKRVRRRLRPEASHSLRA